MSIIVSKCGIHSIGDDRHGYGPFVQRISAAGRQLALVKCRDSFGALDEPLVLWPDIVTIGALTAWDDANYDVNVAYSRIVEESSINPKVKYWEYFNERNGDYAQQADLYIELLPRLTALGIGLCMWNCASGTPFRPGEGNGEGDFAYSQIARSCKVAHDNGDKAILGLHEYASGDQTIGRYQVLADYLDAHDAAIPIAITEYGYETNPGNAQYLTLVKDNDPIYMVDPHVIGCALWTLGGAGWGASNYDTMLPELGEYIATVDPIVIDPIEIWEHDYWDIDGKRIDGNPIQLIMDRAHVVTPHARKKTNQFPLTLNPCPEDADMVIKVDPADMIYPAGTMVTLEAIA